MLLEDRRKLARLMVIQGVSQRALAQAAGWTAHSYLGRLLRGQARTVTPDAAVRIAHHLGVAVDDLFLTRTSMKTGRGDQGRAA